MGHTRANYLTGILPIRAQLVFERPIPDLRSIRAQLGFERPIPDLRWPILDMRWFAVARNSSKVLRGLSFSSAAYFVMVYLLYFVLYVSNICNDTDKR